MFIIKGSSLSPLSLTGVSLVGCFNFAVTSCRISHILINWYWYWDSGNKISKCVMFKESRGSPFDLMAAHCYWKNIKWASFPHLKSGLSTSPGRGNGKVIFKSAVQEDELFYNPVYRLSGQSHSSPENNLSLLCVSCYLQRYPRFSRLFQFHISKCLL